MGYVRLKAILKQRGVSPRYLAEQLGLDMSELYAAMHPLYPAKLSAEQEDRLYEYMVEHKWTRLGREEVFEIHGCTGYEFDTVYKSEAVSRTKRRNALKR